MSKKTPKIEITPDMITAQGNRISMAKAKILLQQPFYGVLLSMMDIIHEPALPTFATDGKHVLFNAAFSAEMTDAELRGVMLHEISHCIYMHCTRKRRLNRDAKRWNIACDYAINLEIRGMGEVLPKVALLDDKYRDMNAEQIYDAMPKDIEKQVETMDDHIELDSDDWDDMEDKILTAYEATRNAQSKGDVPAGIKRWIEKMRKNKVRWERVFHRYIGQALAKDDYSWNRPNRRHVWRDMIMPEMRSYKIGSVVLAIDTSGSIGKEQLEEFAAEIKKISYLVDDITVMTCDASVHEVVKIQHMGEFLTKVKFKGGGGTAFEPVFEEVKKRNITPELLIYLTDGFGSYPQKSLIRYPVIWCITDEAYVNSVPKGLGQVVWIPKKGEF